MTKWISTWMLVLATVAMVGCGNQSGQGGSGSMPSRSSGGGTSGGTGSSP